MASKSTFPTSIPPEFHKYFWDVDATKVNPQEHPIYVINRLLDKGGLEAVRWVRHAFPESLIIETIKKIKDFSPWNGVFWARMYNIPREEVACLEPSYRALRKQLWPY